MKIQLNTDQQIASDLIHKFLADQKSKGNVFTLTGGPGTGKTFMLRDIISEYVGQVQAATVSHAAKNILQDSLGPSVICNTISKILGFEPKILDEGTIKFGPKNPHSQTISLKDSKILIIDEVSQIDDELYGLLMSQASSFGLKVIAVGDPYQLPPVEQDYDSKFFDKIDMTLTIPMRYQGPIATVAGIYKREIDNINLGTGFNKWALNTYTDRIDVFEGNTGYGFTNKLDAIIDLAANDIKSNPSDPSYTRVLAYKNESVAEVNRRIRYKLYGADLRQFEPGEIVICNGGYSVKKPRSIYSQGEIVGSTMTRVPVLYNGQILKVLDHKPTIGPYDVPCELMEFSGKVSNFVEPIYVVSDTEEAREKYNEIKEKLRIEAVKTLDKRIRGLAWQRYYDFIESFAYFDYAYSVNLYKAQGQTLTNVYVCEGEVMGVGPLTWKQKFQALYVAMTRAKQKLYIYNKEF